MKRISVAILFAFPALGVAQEASLDSAGGVDEGTPGVAGVLIAGEADPGAFRVVLRGTYFSQPDFAQSGGDLTGMQSHVGLGYALSRSLTLGGQVSAMSHYGTALQPNDLQSLGDLSFAATFVPVRGDSFSAGSRAGVTLFAGTEPFDGYGSTVSPYLDGIATLRTGPIRTSVNAGFLFDRSEELLRDGTVLDPAQRAAYGVAAGPHIRAGLAIEAPLFSGRLTPFAAARSRIWMGDASGDDAHVVAAGLRWAVPVSGRALAIEGGVDLGLTGDDPEPERPVTPGTRGFLTISLVAPQPKPMRMAIDEPVETEPPAAVAAAPTTGEVKGLVRDATSGEPLAFAVVDVPGKTSNMILTDASGAFRIGELPPGATKLRAQKTGYAVVMTDVTIAAGASASAEVALSPAAKSASGAFAGNVKSVAGAAVAAKMTFEFGGQTKTFSCDANGRFSAPLPPGTFNVKVEAPGFAPQNKTIVVKTGEQTVFNFVLQPTGP